MPFCTRCGNTVQPPDVFCGGCGTRQKGTSAPGVDSFTASLNPRTASMLCYVPVLGWVASIIVLASQKFHDDREVRFHAFQGLYLFVAWLIVDWVAEPFFDFAPQFHVVSKSLKAAVFIAWVFMMVKTAQNQLFKLPVLGELADRSVSEQK